ncbi:hypothetical protein [Romboutsia sp. MSSM.1001216sp_RTP31141st1_G3_RTP31141_220114]|uniref:hypothetical protein n=1 Tax=unclassified Romboutsia TaxID=2626894 RepID=UPI0031B5B058
MKRKIKKHRIDIKNLNKETIDKIDKLANKKGLKRSEFLKIYIENIASQEELFNVFSKYEYLLNRLETSLKNNTKVLNKLNL